MPQVAVKHFFLSNPSWPPPPVVAADPGWYFYRHSNLPAAVLLALGGLSWLIGSSSFWMTRTGLPLLRVAARLLGL